MLSVLLFIATAFESLPTLPFAYLIDRREVTNTHDEFFRHISINLNTTWSQPFTKFFVKSLHPLMDNIGAWAVVQYLLNSITTNE